MVIASTASPFKFVKSVMTAIDEETYKEKDEFTLVEELQAVSYGYSQGGQRFESCFNIAYKRMRSRIYGRNGDKRFLNI